MEATDNPSAAARVLRSLDESIQLLADQPRLGKVFRHRRLRLRLLTHGDYLVFYRERPGSRRRIAASACRAVGLILGRD